MAILYGNELASTSEKRTQTFLATHDGAGNRLPLMERSFLSFSYGGKNIEDFLLVATFNGRLNKNIYSEFEDDTSEYTTVDGQYYWGTRMKNNMLDFTLSTEYMTLNKLEEFKAWFRPGIERPLILAEHPNRYILARVSVAPTINMTPFGEEATVVLPDINTLLPKEYKTKTTIYRGDISLTFVMDDPYWKGILSYMPYLSVINPDIEVDPKIRELLQAIISTNSLDSLDALKICLEDGIPHDINLFNTSNFLIGDTKSYNSIILSRSPAASDINEEPDESNLNNDYPSDEWARTNQSLLSYIPFGAITNVALAGEENAIIYEYSLSDEEGVDLSSSTDLYLFYSGTAPSKPIIKFTLEMTLDQTTGYITNPINSITNTNLNTYSYIKVGNNEFKFTTPGICTAYNKALLILDNIEDSVIIEELKLLFREKLKDKYVKNWAIYCLKDYSLIQNVSSLKTNIKEKILQFFTSRVKFNYIDETRTMIIYYAADFMFNSKTGEAIGKFNCRTPKEPNDGEEIIENVGDMVLSNYLIIDERNLLNANGTITTEDCTKISTNENITNFIISYDNMYY